MQPIRAPYGPTVRQPHLQPLDDPKHDEDMAPDHLGTIPHHDIPRIIPIIKNLRPQFPTKHEGMLEDPLPLIREANAVTDPHTGKQLEYKQLINHPDHELRRMWQRSCANEFRRLAQGVRRRIDSTETIKFLHHHEMPTNR